MNLKTNRFLYFLPKLHISLHGYAVLIHSPTCVHGVYTFTLSFRNRMRIYVDFVRARTHLRIFPFLFFHKSHVQKRKITSIMW